MEKTATGERLTVRRSAERGHADHGWLNTYHTFSFADYYDPAHMGFRSLRVINEDRVKPGRGFGTHPHKDMEILSYVVSGALKHRDSMGHESVIRAGEVQKITAGTGILHSEFNASDEEDVHFLQIWIEPAARGLRPSYQEVAFPPPDKAHPLHLVGSPLSTSARSESNGAVSFHQDVLIYRGILEEKQSLSYSIQPERGCWVQVIDGTIDLNGEVLQSGDGASVENQAEISIAAKEIAELLLFDLA